MATIEVNGQTIGEGQTVSVDHSVTEYKVVIRSMSQVHPDDLKNQIEKKWECVKVEVVTQDVYVSAGRSDF